MKRCQMTVSWNTYPGSGGDKSYGKCGIPAKFRVPNPEMRVEYVCGIHALSLNKMYERTGQCKRCQKLTTISL